MSVETLKIVELTKSLGQSSIYFLLTFNYTMSDYAITTYYNDLENAIHYGGSIITPDGTLKDQIRNDWGVRGRVAPS